MRIGMQADGHATMLTTHPSEELARVGSEDYQTLLAGMLTAELLCFGRWDFCYFERVLHSFES